MHLVTGEVAPLAPLLLPLGEILVWVVAFALCLLCVYLAKALFGAANSAVGWIPYFGKVATRSLTSIEHKIVSFMSEAAASADAKMGAAFHQLARVIDWLGEEIERHANLIELLAGLLAGTAGIALVQRAISNLLRHSQTAQATATHAFRTVIHVQRTIRVGIGHDVLPRIKSLEREMGDVIAHDLPGIRAGERTLGREIGNLWKWTHRHTLLVGSAAFVGAVGWALARLGAGWTRCNNWNKIGKQVCATPASDIESLLALFAGTLALADFRELVKAAQAVEHVAVQGIQDVLRV